MFLAILFLTAGVIAAIVTPFYVRKPDDGTEPAFRVGRFGELVPRPVTPGQRLQWSLGITGALLAIGLYYLWMTFHA